MLEVLFFLSSSLFHFMIDHHFENIYIYIDNHSIPTFVCEDVSIYSPIDGKFIQRACDNFK